MLVSRKHQALILRLRDPSKVTTLIPKSKVFTHNGKQFVAVKHGIDEAKILRNLGFDAPSPMTYYYNWPGRFTPFAHQRVTASFMTLNNRAYNLNDLGSGKTLSTLWAYDYLRSVGRLHKVLVVTPLSTLERVWADEVFQHFSHLTTVVLHGSAEKRLKLLNTDADIYLINHDGIKVRGIVEALAKRPDIDLVIVDELAQVARTFGTDRYKALATIVNKQAPRACWGLTGTPTPNGPMDAWAQVRLLTPERVVAYARKFKDQVMKQISTYIWVPRPQAMEIVHEVMQPALRFHRDDCIDLPECVYQTRTADLTPEQQRAYKDMLNRLKTEIDNGQVLAVNEAVKAQKLIQICCGLAYGTNGEELEVNAAPRMQVVADICEEAPSKVIVFVPFTASVRHVAAYLKEKGFATAVIYGDVGKTERDDILASFMREENPRILVAQPGTMSHGLTLTAASTIIWYAPIPSNDIFEQANARITRPGQKLNQLIVMLEGSDIERRYYKRLKDKQSLQGTLLDMVKESGHREALDTSFNSHQHAYM